MAAPTPSNASSEALSEKSDKHSDIIESDNDTKQKYGIAHIVSKTADANVRSHDEPSTPPVAKDEEAPQDQTPATPSPFDPASFPDGGLQAWTVVAGGWCILFCSFGWINCIGVFQNYYETHQLRDFSPSTVSWIVSLESFMMFFGGPIIGKLYDNYGPRYLLIVGSFLHVFGLMMASISSKYYQFILAQGICSPIGASMIFYPAMNTVSSWFFKNRAFAFGVLASGSSLGGVILPILVQRLIPEVGFGWAMRIAAFLILGLLIIANLTVKSRLPPRPRPLVLMEFIHPLSEPVYAINVASSFLFFLAMFIPFAYLIIEAQVQGMSANLASYLIPILNAASLFGRILPGWIADRVGRFNVMIVMTGFTAIMVLALWIPSNNNASIIVFSLFYGFGTGAFVSLAPALIAQITKDLSKLGVRTGTMFAIISIAALVGNPIAGAIVSSQNGSFTGLKIFCGVVQMAGVIGFILARIAAGGAKLKVKV